MRRRHLVALLDAAERECDALVAELDRNRRAIRFALGDLEPGIQPHGTLADLLPADPTDGAS